MVRTTTGRNGADMTAEHGDHGPGNGPPDADWFAYVKHWFELNQDRRCRNLSGRLVEHEPHRRANPCPFVVGMTGPWFKPLVRVQPIRAVVLHAGTTFSPPEGLRVGDVVNGWALKKITQPQTALRLGEHDPKS